MRSQMAVSSEIRDCANMLSRLFDRRERCRDGARALLDDGSIVLFEAGIKSGPQIARVPYLGSVAAGDSAHGAMARLDDFRQRIAASTEFDVDRAIERNRGVHIGNNRTVRAFNHLVEIEGLAESKIVPSHIDGISTDARRRGCFPIGADLHPEASPIQRPAHEFSGRKKFIDDRLVGFASNLLMHLHGERVFALLCSRPIERKFERMRRRFDHGAIERLRERGRDDQQSEKRQ